MILAQLEVCEKLGDRNLGKRGQNPPQVINFFGGSEMPQHVHEWKGIPKPDLKNISHSITR